VKVWCAAVALPHPRFLNHRALVGAVAPARAQAIWGSPPEGGVPLWRALARVLGDAAAQAAPVSAIGGRKVILQDATDVEDAEYRGRIPIIHPKT
jgi:hypothetical protein